MRRRLSVLFVVAGIVLSGATGCLVRTHPAHHGGGGHHERSDERHCHNRGGKHDKVVCHAHPHGPGHH